MRKFKEQLNQAAAKREAMTRPLTAKQREILSFVQAHIDRFHFPPTRVEIATAFDCYENNIQQHLLLIQRKGYIKLSRAARSIEILAPFAL